MQVYYFDEENEYVGSVPADIDPLESQLQHKNIYLLPAHATFTEPLPPKNGFKIKWNGTEWYYEEIPKDPEPEPPTLEEIKQAKIASLKAERDHLEDTGFIRTDWGDFDFDPKARERISLAIVALEMSGGTVEWTLYDNTVETVNAEQLKDVVAGGAVLSNRLHVAYRNAKEKVEQATTKEEVEAVTLFETPHEVEEVL